MDIRAWFYMVEVVARSCEVILLSIHGESRRNLPDSYQCDECTRTREKGLQSLESSGAGSPTVRVIHSEADVGKVSSAVPVQGRHCRGRASFRVRYRLRKLVLGPGMVLMQVLLCSRGHMVFCSERVQTRLPMTCCTDIHWHEILRAKTEWGREVVDKSRRKVPSGIKPQSSHSKPQ